MDIKRGFPYLFPIFLSLLIFVGCDSKYWPRYEFNWQTWRFEKVSYNSSHGPKSPNDLTIQEEKEKEKEKEKKEDKKTEPNAEITSKQRPTRAMETKPETEIKTETLISERDTNAETKEEKKTATTIREDNLLLIPSDSKYKETILSSRNYRLYLILPPSKSKDKTEAAIEDQPTYIVNHAPLDKLSELIGILFIGEGPGGNQKRRFIIYSDINVLNEAKAMAKELDMNINDISINNNDIEKTSNLWQEAIVELYQSEFPYKLPANKRHSILTKLNTVLSDDTYPSHIRWAAGIIGANLAARYAPTDYLVAISNLVRVGSIEKISDYNRLVANYYRIKYLKARNQDLMAKKIADLTIRRFKHLSRTICYQNILLEIK